MGDALLLVAAWVVGAPLVVAYVALTIYWLTRLLFWLERP